MSDHAWRNALEVANNPEAFHAETERLRSEGRPVSQRERAEKNGGLTNTAAAATLVGRIIREQPLEEIAARVAIGSLKES